MNNYKVVKLQFIKNNFDSGYYDDEEKFPWEVDFTGEVSKKVYYYKSELEVKEGDIVVVASKTGLGLAKIVGVIENTFENADEVNKATSFVVAVVDISYYRKKREVHVKRAYILRQLEERKKEIQEEIIYRAIAKEDGVTAKLLEELSSLDK